MVLFIFILFFAVFLTMRLRFCTLHWILSFYSNAKFKIKILCFGLRTVSIFKNMIILSSLMRFYPPLELTLCRMNPTCCHQSQLEATNYSQKGTEGWYWLSNIESSSSRGNIPQPINYEEYKQWIITYSLRPEKSVNISFPLSARIGTCCKC